MAILSIGHVGNFAVEACQELNSEGMFPAHFDLRFVKPLDELMLHEVFQKFDRVITVEDGCLQGGMGSAVLEFMIDKGYTAKVKRLGIPDKIIEHGEQIELQKSSLSGSKLQALEQFLSKGFPTKKDEEYKYTHLKEIVEKDYNFSASEHHSISKKQLDELHLGEEHFDFIVFVNGKLLPLHDRQRLQFSYNVETDGSQFNEEYIFKELQITDGIYVNSQNSYTFSALTDENVNRLRNNPMVKSVTKNIDTIGNTKVFPHTKSWNADNFGPIYIPQAGKTVVLNKETLPFYKEIITDYEKNELQVNGDEIKINGKVVSSYTFQMDYYWMMGDNRHNSEDSRYWGYVPADHIVGKPVFIWMSLDQNEPWGKLFDKVRWERMFTTVGGSGKPVSYFIYFVIALVAWFGFDYFRKKRKKSAE